MARPFVVLENDAAGEGAGGAVSAEVMAETAALISELDAGSAGPTAPPTVNMGPGVEPGQPLEAIYAAAQVPDSPYTAEQLLKVIDGLRHMPREAVMSMINVMDEADPNWAVEDVLVDVDRKTRALETTISALSRRVQQERETARTPTENADSLLAEATTEIRRQINELEDQLAEFQADAAKQKAQAESKLHELEHAAAGESHRLSGEIERLRGIARFLQVTNPEKG